MLAASIRHDMVPGRISSKSTDMLGSSSSVDTAEEFLTVYQFEDHRNRFGRPFADAEGLWLNCQLLLRCPTISDGRAVLGPDDPGEVAAPAGVTSITPSVSTGSARLTISHWSSTRRHSPKRLSDISGE